MPYRYTTFNGIRLPEAMTEDDLGAPPAQSTIVDSIAGGFNYLGNNRYYAKRHPIRYRGMYVAAPDVFWTDEAGNYIVDEAGNNILTYRSSTILRSRIDDIKAQHGKWAALVRRREDDGIEQFKYGRLLDVQHIRTLGDANRIARLDLAFECEGLPWRSTFGSNVFVSLSANTTTPISVTPTGSEDVRDAIFTITATGGTITEFEIGRSDANYYKLTWLGTLTIGQSLVIDTGAQTVKKNGVDAYSGFALGSQHNAQDWMLLRGRNAINTLQAYVSLSTATLDITYFDQWA